MSTPDFFRARLDGMIDLNHPLAILRHQICWDELETILRPFFMVSERMGKEVKRREVICSAARYKLPEVDQATQAGHGCRFGRWCH